MKTSPVTNSLKMKIGSGLVGLLALGGVAAVAAPTAFAQDDAAPQERVLTQEQIDQKLDRLADAVESGRFTQEQADEIAERIESGEFVGRQGRRGHGNKLGSLTEALGIEADELRAGFEAGQTLAEIAEANGISSDDLIDTLVTQFNERIDAKLADGSIDAEKAEEIRSNIEERITEKVNSTPGERGNGLRGGGAPDVEPAGA